MQKKYYVARGGRDIIMTKDYNMAMLVSQNQPDRIQEFLNYGKAAEALVNFGLSARQHSSRPQGIFLHLDASVSMREKTAEVRVMMGDRVVEQIDGLQGLNPNQCEFIGLVIAMKYAQKNAYVGKIYCDNMNAVRLVQSIWGERQSPGTYTLSRGVFQIPGWLQTENRKAYSLLEDSCEAMYDEALQPFRRFVEFWDSSMYGQIPSDYGRK